VSTSSFPSEHRASLVRVAASLPDKIAWWRETVPVCAGFDGRAELTPMKLALELECLAVVRFGRWLICVVGLDQAFSQRNREIHCDRMRFGVRPVRLELIDGFSARRFAVSAAPTAVQIESLHIAEEGLAGEVRRPGQDGEVLAGSENPLLQVELRIFHQDNLHEQASRGEQVGEALLGVLSQSACQGRFVREGRLDRTVDEFRWPPRAEPDPFLI